MHQRARFPSMLFHHFLSFPPDENLYQCQEEIKEERTFRGSSDDNKPLLKAINLSKGVHNQTMNIINKSEIEASTDKTPSHDAPQLTALIKLL